ncbi:MULTISPECIES: alpha/beta hydrolase [Paraliobacillus]|uniref:alpha/beta hydrolase n=1 Tax=Paraliobacillus TaxID=200903 RepID=UPI001300837A|nr:MULTISPECIES: alpha/beta hydrolase [Paraliobacillus]
MRTSLNKQLNQTNLFTKPSRSFASSFSSMLILANSLTIIAGIVYLLIDSSNGLWNIYGIFMMLTLLGNFIVAAIPSNQKGLDYFYLTFTILIMLLLPILNSIASFDPLNTTSRSMVSIILLLSLFILGGIIAGTTRKSLNNMGYIRFSNTMTQDKKGFFHILMISLWILCLLLGAYVSFLLIRGENNGSIVELFVPGYALFFSLITLAIVALILRMRTGKNLSFISIITSIIGIAVSITFSVPLVTTVLTFSEMENDFSNTLNEADQNSLTDSMTDTFLDVPFSLPAYFFGLSTENYNLEQDTLFYSGTEGVDEGIELHFDAYLPTSNPAQLPGNSSVLIRIHGGGWTIGDKGSSNNAAVNKYFASQGYVVFDIQYGLSSEDKFVEFAPVPENIVADFSLDDMVRHIGLFTNYLVENNDDYNANLDSVFISGASAGGQLANAAGLGLTSENYQDVLNPELDVNGIIPIYPANGLAKNIGIAGSDSFMDTSLLVKEDSPPALIFQGDADGIVDASISRDFYEAYRENGNEQATLLMMPYAGHNGDYYFASYYNQAFIYYMERFMYVNK